MRCVPVLLKPEMEDCNYKQCQTYNSLIFFKILHRGLSSNYGNKTAFILMQISQTTPQKKLHKF